ncbi:uncharacterized protein LOC134934209 [Pseudophryne corroboree]|uniref:uncharacterized protein LOC134934209 n=1 Tax=Pseudophryne corroboree TaxID=495146 RepID=UPI003081E076
MAVQGDRSISQLDELIAVPGAEVTIPCHYPQEAIGAAQKVTWYRGDNELCSQEKYELYTWDQQHRDERYSLVSFPTDVSLRIHRYDSSSYTHYCCSVTTSNGTFTSRASTELVIADTSSSAKLYVMQPNNITADTGGSVTLNCSGTFAPYHRARHSLSLNIYWRVNSTSGPYAYHPHQEMIHPRYKGRIEILKVADLHIQGVQAEDSATYYCFMIITRCVYEERTLLVASHGEGTSLIVKESSHKSPGKGRNLVIAVSVSFSFKLIVICVMVIYTTGTEPRTRAGI